MDLIATVAAVLAASILLTTVAEADDPPDPERVREVAAMLSDTPAGLGHPITDRAAWDALASTAALARGGRQRRAPARGPCPSSPRTCTDFSRTA